MKKAAGPTQRTAFLEKVVRDPGFPAPAGEPRIRHAMGPGSQFTQSRYGDDFEKPPASSSDVFGKQAAQGQGLRRNKGARGGE